MPIVDAIGNRYGIPVAEPHFGVEIEVEEVFDEPDVSGTGWSTTGDGSLRNGGIEFLSHSPRSKARIVNDVATWYDWYLNSDWSAGIRCSTHVHVNVLGHTVRQICAAAVLYTLVEPLLYRYCGPVREENIYCVPWYRARDDLHTVADANEGNDIRIFSMTCKYSGLFLHPTQTYGTMEFRQAPVFERKEELLDWIEMLERIVYAGFDTPEQVVESFMEQTVDEFVKGIFGEHLYRVLRDACEQDFEYLLDKYDVETNAEIALACTYKPKLQWDILDFGIEGDGARGYHVARHLQGMRYFQEPEFYEPEEEYYDEEEDY